MSPRSAFLNVPYDKQFESLFLAYLVGIRGFGLVPKATIELPSSSHRIHRIIELIHSCDCSFHDLSRVEVAATVEAVPRFNMPFELGLAYHHSTVSSHKCFLFEADHRRLERTLSDLKGVDSYEHRNEVKLLFSGLSSALVTEDPMPTVLEMQAVYEMIADALPQIKQDAGSDSVFHARVFDEVVFAIGALWNGREVRRRSSQA